MNGAIDPLQKNTGAIRLIGQRQRGPGRPKSSVLLDEIELGKAHKRSDPSYVIVVHLHEPGPPTTVRTSLTLKVNPLFHSTIQPAPLAATGQPGLSEPCNSKR
jgi:hypothetical protein